MSLDTSWAIAWVKTAAASLAEHRVELTNLDREIGDADHGENMNRGFEAVSGKLASLPAEATPSDVFKLVATTLISTVGGASGPLYGTAFLKAAMATVNKPELDSADIVTLLDAAKNGIISRGKAEVGDKTMIDAWEPAVAAARSASAAGKSAAETLEAAATAAKNGAESTIPLVAHKGRASYLGERAIGHRDPGATSTEYILAAAYAAAGQGA